MGFGPLDLFAVFLGPLWLAKEALKESSEKKESHLRIKNIDEYVEKHSHKQFELKVRDFVEDPANYDAIYNYLEEFKKQNTEWCKKNESHIKQFRGWEWGSDAWYSEPHIGDDWLDWYNVGLERVPFYGGRNNYDRMLRKDNRNRASKMIMNSIGLETVSEVAMRAKELYGSDSYPY